MLKPRKTRLTNTAPGGALTTFDGRWTANDRFLRAVLGRYLMIDTVEYRDTLDRAEANAPTPPQPSAPMTAWVVGPWFTRAHMMEAWYDLYQQVDNVSAHPDHYAETNRYDDDSRMAKAKGKRTHPMDTTVRHLLQTGILIKGGRDRFFVSEQHCAALEMHAAWEVHAGRLTAHTTTLIDTVPAWKKVYAELIKSPVFDRTHIAKLAATHGITGSDSALSGKIKRWLRDGLLEKIAPNLYTDGLRAIRPHDPDQTQVELSDWLYEFIRMQASYQLRVPDAYFTQQDILDTLAEKSDEWLETNYPDGIDTHSLASRMSKACHPGLSPADAALITRRGHGLYAVHARLLAYFKKVSAISVEERAAEVLKAMVLAGNEDRPKWFTRPDIETALPQHAADSASIIHHLLTEELIARRGEIYDVRLGRDSRTYAEHVPIYTATVAGYAAAGYPAFFTDSLPLRRSADAFPYRMPPAWETPGGELNQWLAKYESYYKEMNA